MKITRVETLHCDAGLTGYSECSNAWSPDGIAGCIKDDVPWKDDLVTEPLEIVDGYLRIPARPGRGAYLHEKELARHPWS